MTKKRAAKCPESRDLNINQMAKLKEYAKINGLSYEEVLLTSTEFLCT